jgi:HSP20 family molecular chaperone IbpA
MERTPQERLLALREKVDRLIREFMEIGMSMGGAGRTGGGGEISVDISETEGVLKVEIDLPGSKKKDLLLSTARGVIVVEGRKRVQYGGKKSDQQFLCMERGSGKFKRVIELPRPVDGRTFDTSMENGVLTVSAKLITERRGQRRPLPIR